MASENASSNELTLPPDDESLLADCTVYTFLSSGKGGQSVNKTESAVRLRHNATGIVVTCRQERSQYRNKMICLKRLRDRLEKMLETAEPRITTTIPVKEKRKRLENKSHQAYIKRMRKKLVHGEEE